MVAVISVTCEGLDELNPPSCKQLQSLSNCFFQAVECVCLKPSQANMTGFVIKLPLVYYPGTTSVFVIA